MIQSKEDLNEYLVRDMVSSNIPEFTSFSSKVKQLIFPNYEWAFIKALRYLEYCENVKKNTFYGGGEFIMVIC